MIDATRIGMPLEEFLRLSSQQPFELINGEKKPKLPNVFGHGEMIRILFRLLDAFVLTRALGDVFFEMTFILPDTYNSGRVEGSRIPDLMFYAANRIADYKAQNPDHRSRPLALVPDLVIEIVSPNDKISEMDEKIDAYLLDGVRLLWVIDPQRRKTVIYAPDMEQPRISQAI
jgi:Uma2 family endonuclease